jgi:hypothetical protein
MHTVEILDQAVELAGQLGYTVRQECFAGSGGGACQLKGRKILFIDLDLGPNEQLEQVVEALQSEQITPTLPISPELGEMLKVRKIA